MKAYIISSKAISPQETFVKEFPLETVSSPEIRMHAIEPDYKQFIHPMKLRRMSRVVKMGVASALQCLKDGEIEEPDAIITSTGWGCLADTFKFLDEIGEKKEETLSPSTFIQSTHNTVGGQIALLLGCQEYNSVYVNDSSSFEHGLLDALLLLKEGKEFVLIGGIDEVTETDFNLKEKAGWWKTKIDTPYLPHSNSSGTIAGEGSAFFLLSGNSNGKASSYIRGIKFARGNNPGETLTEFLADHKLSTSEIDIVISGINGDTKTNSTYLDFINTNLNSAESCYYKHLTGDFDSASAFALWISNQIIHTQLVPDYIKINKESNSAYPINEILIHHFKQPSEHAFILVSKTGI